MNSCDDIADVRPLGVIDSRRRRIVAGAGAALGALAAPRIAKAQSGSKIRIGYWPTAEALPFYVALEKDFFKEAGIEVEPVRVITTAQLMEAIRSGRAEGSANGTGSADLASREITAPGTLKIIASNGSNAEHVLEEFLVAKDSPLKSISELEGKNVGSWPDRQNIALCTMVLQKAGVGDAIVNAFPVGQHISALDDKQVDAMYTFEPMGTAGRLKDTTRLLEGGVVAKYVLGDAKAKWFNGAATLATDFVRKYPDETKKYLMAYRRGVEFVRKEPKESRQYFKGYTTIEEPVAKELPLPAYTIYDEFESSDIEMLQKVLDLLAEKTILDQRVTVASMIYK